MILIGFYNRYRYQRRLSFLLHTRPLKTHPEISLYALFVAIDGTHSNGFYNTSGGKEVHQLGMAISPLCVIMAALWFRPDGGHTSKIRGAIAMCSILMLILFSAEYDVYIPYHVTVMTAIWAILHGSLLAGFALMAKYYLHEMSLSQIIHSMNLSCVVLLPVVMVLTGELSLLLTATLPGQRNTIVPVYGIIVMAILQLLNQIASLHLVNVTSPLHYLASRGLAWVPVTLIITFGFRIEMLISTFKGFFIAVGVFLMSLVEELRKPKL
ncbi:predicted protein [Nematostella vectensis]|uniref:Sugar phosphate transporter domain-containing protein n=1 Tax=Nematostella vectensis TaxID=45351 RepID=A7RH43_NEMVE|nr:predicted protein [Nematostella vectensis]|eukprot:XP_001641351.1 predicted protein [Nematostella vectensis]